MQVCACLLLLFCVWGQALSPQLVEDQTCPDVNMGLLLREARAFYPTNLKYTRQVQQKLYEIGFGRVDPPVPPDYIFDLITYKAPLGENQAYLTYNPHDGERHPAVIWAHGGVGGLDEWFYAAKFWPNPFADDQRIPAAFIEAGFVVMTPSWRGENLNAGQYEMYWGEIDDLFAARDHLASLSWVDPDRIYLAGHMQGATLALLASELEGNFRAIFAICASLDVEAELEHLEYIPFNPLNSTEGLLRSPLAWARGITRPTFVFEPARRFDDSGEMQGSEDMTIDTDKWWFLGNIMSLKYMATTYGVPLNTYIIPKVDQYSIMYPVTGLIAMKILEDEGPNCDISITQDDVKQTVEEMLEDMAYGQDEEGGDNHWSYDEYDNVNVNDDANKDLYLYSHDEL